MSGKKPFVVGNVIKQVTRGHNIVMDRGIQPPSTPRHPSTLTITHKKYLKHQVSHFLNRILWMDGWTDRETKPFIELRVLILKKGSHEKNEKIKGKKGLEYKMDYYRSIQQEFHSPCFR